VSKWMLLPFVLFVGMSLLVSCRANTPKSASQAITLMSKYGSQGRYDEAIRVAKDWLKQHPEDSSQKGILYEQMGIAYLVKASRDAANGEKWIEQAVAYFDKDLSIDQPKGTDIMHFTVGHDFERAGDLSSSNGCLYYARAIKAFEDEVPFLQGDSVTAYGTTVPLAPVRQENQKALESVKTKFAKAGCKSQPT
jgi:tetratricopeptide (TPR) repeat protein